MRALNLSGQELRERLLTLKNYGVWKRTKAKRINCKELAGDESSAIIHAAASYGYRHGHNEVFAEFVRGEQEAPEGRIGEARQRYQS